MRLIDADKLRKKLAVSFVNHMDAEIALSVLDKQETVDAEPVVHGRWINCFDKGMLIVGYSWRCSECGTITNDTRMGKPRNNYCPNCGARMDLSLESETSDKDGAV